MGRQQVPVWAAGLAAVGLLVGGLVALVLVVSAGLVRSGAVHLITRTFIDAERPMQGHIAIMGGIGAALSAFMNNVAALALLMPVDIQTARKAGRAVGLTLMPLSFATILGGMATLIGAVGGVIVVFTVPMLDRMKIDDVVGAIPVHLFAGIWGTLAVPLTNSGATFLAQLVGIVSIGLFVALAALLLAAPGVARGGHFEEDMPDFDTAADRAREVARPSRTDTRERRLRRQY